MIISRLALLAIALTALSPIGDAHSYRYRNTSSATWTSGFGSCIRNVDTAGAPRSLGRNRDCSARNIACSADRVVIG